MLAVLNLIPLFAIQLGAAIVGILLSLLWLRRKGPGSIKRRTVERLVMVYGGMVILLWIADFFI
jgi:hypothetical protein